MEDIKTPVKQGRVVVAILLSALVVVGICALLMFYINNRNIEQVGVNKAKALADQVTTLRTFYTTQVVSRAKKAGMKVNYDWNTEPDTLPLPATFTNVLGKEIEKANPGTSIRLYSRYPFPHRKDTEDYDDFELDERDSTDEDNNTDYGHAWTAAYLHQISPRLRIGAEYMEIDTHHCGWEYYGLSPQARERLAQLTLRWQFGP